MILRDPEGRAAAEDLREAAEVAAFFSDARASRRGGRPRDAAQARAARRAAAPGRVLVGHSETVRVAPRDPEGRLRRR